MDHYQHTQIGWLVIWIMIPVITLLVLIMALDTVVIVGMVTGIILLLCLVLFGSLTVSVTPEVVHVRFGPGPIARRFPVADIRGAEKVKNCWYHGWGIRYTSDGWMFNVSGFDAVRLTMVDGQKFRIGTDEPDALLEAIRQHCPGPGAGGEW